MRITRMSKKEDNHKSNNVTKFPSSKKERTNRVKQKVSNDMPHKPKSEPIFNLPPVAQNLSLLLLGIHIILFFLPNHMMMFTVYNLSFIPARYTEAMPFDIFAIISPITHMLLHGGWMHVLINVGMLMAFGSGVEKSLGSRRMLIVFIVSGVVGAVTHFVFYYGENYSLIGASGGISGLFAAMLVMLDQQGGDKKRLIIIAAVWVGISLLFGIIGMVGTKMDIAWTAHIGGFFAGLCLTYHWLQNKYR